VAPLGGPDPSRWASSNRGEVHPLGPAREKERERTLRASRATGGHHGPGRDGRDQAATPSLGGSRGVGTPSSSWPSFSAAAAGALFWWLQSEQSRSPILGHGGWRKSRADSERIRAPRLDRIQALRHSGDRDRYARLASGSAAGGGPGANPRQYAIDSTLEAEGKPISYEVVLRGPRTGRPSPGRGAAVTRFVTRAATFARRSPSTPRSSASPCARWALGPAGLSEVSGARTGQADDPHALGGPCARTLHSGSRRSWSATSASELLAALLAVGVAWRVRYRPSAQSLRSTSTATRLAISSAQPPSCTNAGGLTRFGHPALTFSSGSFRAIDPSWNCAACRPRSRCSCAVTHLAARNRAACPQVPSTAAAHGGRALVVVGPRRPARAVSGPQDAVSRSRSWPRHNSARPRRTFGQSRGHAPGAAIAIAEPRRSFFRVRAVLALARAQATGGRARRRSEGTLCSLPTSVRATADHRAVDASSHPSPALHVATACVVRASRPKRASSALMLASTSPGKSCAERPLWAARQRPRARGWRAFTARIAEYVWSFAAIAIATIGGVRCQHAIRASAGAPALAARRHACSFSAVAVGGLALPRPPSIHIQRLRSRRATVARAAGPASARASPVR
jgi:hypothetical protein